MRFSIVFFLFLCNQISQYKANLKLVSDKVDIILDENQRLTKQLNQIKN